MSNNELILYFYSTCLLKYGPLTLRSVMVIARFIMFIVISANYWQHIGSVDLLKIYATISEQFYNL